jgi:predicted DNA-binding transcriptional regulator YafY
MQRTERLLFMMERINSGRRPSVEWFVEKCECSERTILADIQFLKENMRMAIEYDRFNGGYINSDPKRTLPPIELTEGELFALALGKEMLTEYSGTAFEPILEAAIQKIMDRLPDRAKISVADLSGAVRFKPPGMVALDSRKSWFDFNRACEESKIVQVTYFSAHSGQLTIREIEPHRMVESRGAWYVIAWCRSRNDLRQFALHRIREYKLTADTFEKRENVDVDKYLEEVFLLEHGDAVQRYVIKFDPVAARYVRERRWHPSQEIAEHDDGSCTLSFNAARTDEVKRWVLVFGSGAEVLEPQTLRDILRDEFERGLEVYSDEVRSSSSVKGNKVAAREGQKQKPKTLAERDDSDT